MKKFPFLSVFFFTGLFCQKQDSIVKIETQEYKVSDHSTLIYKKPRISDIYSEIPHNFIGVAKNVVAKDTYGYSLVALGATIALIPVDPILIRASRTIGENMGFNEDHTYHKLGPLKIIPGDVGSFIYFMGNGTTFLLIGSGLAAYGLIVNDYRALSTSMQVVQSILLSGLFSQPIKRITGRESPFVTMNNDRQHSYWSFMPSFSAYQKTTSKYDAMPSGHLTTGIAAWIILAENYPEKKWIKPLGFTLMGAMCLEMVQSKVHWASDYPIAILLGYLIGKNIAKNALSKKVGNTLSSEKKKYVFNIASSNFYGVQTMGMSINF